MRGLSVELLSQQVFEDVDLLQRVRGHFQQQKAVRRASA